MIRILHICFSGQYIDGWGYQENLLPKYLTLEGTENVVISSSSADCFPSFVSDEKRAEILAKGDDYVYEGVRIIRIPAQSVTSSLVFAPNLYDTICKVKPDVIFHHDVVFATFPAVKRYLRKNPAVLFIDNHADELNMSRRRLWNFFYHKIANRFACRSILKYVRNFYGVTPARCDFLRKYYHLPADKIALLPIGADSIMADGIASKKELRKKYGFCEDEIIIVSGGKMGEDKGTPSLIKAVEGSGRRLILFGSFNDAYTEEMARKSSFVTLPGWCDRKKTLELLKLSDLACWPIHHTTLIEDAVSVETPILVRQSGNVSHLMTGNGMWTSVMTLKDDIDCFFSMDAGLVAECAAQARERIDYRNIAKQVLNDVRK